MTEHFGSNSIAHLRRVVDMVESIERQIAKLNKQKSEVYKSAKKTGLEVKPIKSVIQARRQDPKKRAEHGVMFNTYFDALSEQKNNPPKPPMYPDTEPEEENRDETFNLDVGGNADDVDETDQDPDQELDKDGNTDQPHSMEFADKEVPDAFKETYD